MSKGDYRPVSGSSKYKCKGCGIKGYSIPFSAHWVNCPVRKKEINQY